MFSPENNTSAIAAAAAVVLKEAAQEAAKILATAGAVNQTTVALMGADITFIKEKMNKIENQLSESSKNSVNLNDYTLHLTAHADHEVRLRDIEGRKDEAVLVKKLVFGCVTMILVAVVTSLIYLVVKK